MPGGLRLILPFAIYRGVWVIMNLLQLQNVALDTFYLPNRQLVLSVRMFGTLTLDTSWRHLPSAAVDKYVRRWYIINQIICCFWSNCIYKQRNTISSLSRDM